MNQIWIVVAVLVALLVFTRIRSRRRAKPTRPPSAGPRIQGYQVSAYVHPRMSAACLYDNGLQFGRGFRRKEGPSLPHDAACRCEAVPFTFTSSEVFNGALRRVGAVKSTIEELTPADATRLIERLKAVEAQPLPGGADDYVQAVAEDGFPAGVREALIAFLHERYAYLREAPREPASLPETPTTDPMDNAKST